MTTKAELEEQVIGLEDEVNIVKADNEVLEAEVKKLTETNDVLRTTIVTLEKALENAELSLLKAVSELDEERELGAERLLEIAKAQEETIDAIYLGAKDPPQGIKSLPYRVPSGPSHKAHTPE